jgi:CheY-like chemotaxis protein
VAKERISREHNQLKALFASNEEQGRDGMRRLLEQFGYKVTLCVNGAEVVGLACRQRFDVIIMDIDLSIIDGWEAAKIIRSHGNNQNTSMVAIIDRAGADERMKMLDSPFDDYVEKSLGEQALLEVINKYAREAQELKALGKSSEIICKIAADGDYKQVIERMVCELPQWVAKMREAFDRNDLQELEFQTQTLKEQAVSAGLEHWAEKATDIEKIIHTEQIEKINKKLDELVQMCVKTQMRRKAEND